MLKFTCMKATLLCILAFISTTCLAQNGFFLEPGIGLGFSNVKASGPPDEYPFSYGPTGWYTKTKSIFTYNPSLLIGYKHRGWSLTTGISYLRTGYTDDQMFFLTLGTNEPNDVMTEYYYHVIIPLIFSEQFKLDKHFFIKAGFGFALSYNTSAAEKFTETGIYYYGGAGIKQPLTKDEFDQTYFRVVGWEILRLHLGYKVNDQLSFVAGPEYQFMLSSFVKNNDNYLINRAYTFKLGATWSLKHPKPVTPPATISTM